MKGRISKKEKSKAECADLSSRKALKKGSECVDAQAQEMRLHAQTASRDLAAGYFN